jgi:outer membrane lipoprotein-sorting protein
MKRKVFVSALLALAVITIGSAQDLDKILKDHFKAVGQKNLDKITSLETTGTASSMGMDMGFVMQAKRPDKLKIVIEVQGAQIIQAVDGQTVWAVNPMMGSSTPMELTGAEAENLIGQADMDGPLWNYQDKGHQLALEGTEDVNGKECYVLKLTKSNDNTDYYFIDKESSLIQKVRTSTVSNGVPMEVEAFQSNYKDVGGYMMPFSIEQRVGGQVMMNLDLENVEANVEIDDAVFAKPASN